MLDTADVGWEGRLANVMPRAHAAAAASARALTDGASVFDDAEGDGEEYCAALMLLRSLHERQAEQEVVQHCERCKQQKCCCLGFRLAVRARREAPFVRSVR